MKRILYVATGDIVRGGIQKCIQSWVENFPHRDELDITWCCPGSDVNREYYEYLLSLGIHIVACNISRGKGIHDPKFRRDLDNLLKRNTYDLVHVNAGGILSMYCAVKVAKRHSIPMIIAHSHSAPQMSRVKRFVAPFFRWQIAKNSDYLLACSDAAGIHMFGKAAIKGKKYHLIRNGIQFERYTFHADKRDEVREKADCGGKTVFGYVGRFSREKNPLFMLSVFSEIHKRDDNTVLWMVGDGELRPEIEQKIAELGLSDCVTLWGARGDANELMQGMDAFLFPSIFEGLGIAAIEAQAAGLSVYASDSISAEHKITDLLRFISLSGGAENWGTKILKDMENQAPRRDTSKEIRAAGYDIRECTKVLEELYFT